MAQPKLIFKLFPILVLISLAKSDTPGMDFFSPFTSLATGTLDSTLKTVNELSSNIMGAGQNLIDFNNFDNKYGEIIKHTDETISGAFQGIFGNLFDPMGLSKQLFSAKDKLFHFIKGVATNLLQALKNILEQTLKLLQPALESGKMLTNIGEQASNILQNPSKIGRRIGFCANMFFGKLLEKAKELNVDKGQCIFESKDLIQQDFNVVEKIFTFVVNSESHKIVKDAKECQKEAAEEQGNAPEVDRDCVENAVENMEKSAEEIHEDVAILKESLPSEFEGNFKKLKECVEAIKEASKEAVESLKKGFNSCEGKPILEEPSLET